jgi:hypothetical protein
VNVSVPPFSFTEAGLGEIEQVVAATSVFWMVKLSVAR